MENDLVKRVVAILGILFFWLPASPAVRADRGAGQWLTEEFTESVQLSRWGYGATDQHHENRLVADPGMAQTGKASLKLDTGTGLDTWVYFPNTRDLDLDVTGCAAFEFHLTSRNQHPWQEGTRVVFRDMEGRQASFTDQGQRTHQTTKGWVRFEVPVGAQAASRASKLEWKAQIDSGFAWKHVACVEIHSDTWDYGFQNWYDGVRFTGPAATRWWLSSLDKPDLTVTYAEQVPTYFRYFPDYPDGYPVLQPDKAVRKRWPDAGERVVYQVHVRNVGRRPSPATDFECRLGGQVAHRGGVPPLAVGQETILKVPWSWRTGSHPFLARVDTRGTLDEISRQNNQLEFQTDAYTLAAFCEKGMARRVSEVTSAYGSFSYEDWLRASTVDTMNGLFKHSRYDFAPRGAEVSVRIYKVFLVDKLGDESQMAGDHYGRYDGAWTYPEKGWPEYCNLANSFMHSLNHELSHQIGVIDDYRLDLPPEKNRVNGKPFSQPDGGLMGGGRVSPNSNPAYADMDVAGLNMAAGHRRGYYGDYLYNLPRKNTLVLSVGGRPLAGAQVEVFQKSRDTEEMAAPPIQTGRTDGRGQFTLSNRPVKKSITTETGCTLSPNPFGTVDVVGRTGLLLVRARRGKDHYYGFLDIGRCVVEYARGHRQAATYPLELQPE